jgi:very-short-patch-repair endonuclease
MKIKEKLNVYLIYLGMYFAEHPEVIFVGQAAAVIWGIPRWDAWDYLPHTYGTRAMSMAGKHQYKFSWVWRDGKRVSCLPDTLLALARGKDSQYSLITSISHCLKEKLISAEALSEFIAKRSGCSGINQLRHALDYASNLDGSALETYFRLLCLDQNFIDFQQQVRFYYGDFGEYYDVDFYVEYDGKRLVVEVDGKSKAEMKTEYYAYQTKRDDFFRRQGIILIHTMYDEMVSGEYLKKLEEVGLPRKTTPYPNISAVPRYRTR